MSDEADTEFHAFWRSVIVHDLDRDFNDETDLDGRWSLGLPIALVSAAAIWFAIWSVL